MQKRKDNTFTVIKNNKEKVQCEILFTYHDERTDKDYIVYTDKTIDKKGNTKVYASIFNPQEENPTLFPIETDEEWELIETILDSLTDDYAQ